MDGMASKGRIPKLNPETVGIITRGVADGMPRRHAAALAGVSESAVAKWLAAGRKKTSGPHFQFVQAIKKAEAEAIARNVTVVQAAADKSWQAAAWWLERRFPDEFGSESRTVRELKKIIERLTAK